MSEHERIFLEPAPGADEEYGRQWCQHGVWDDGVEYVRADVAEDEITTLRKDLAEARAENKRLKHTFEFVQRWAWREDPPHAARNLSDRERLNAIKFHPHINPRKAKGETV